MELGCKKTRCSRYELNDFKFPSSNPCSELTDALRSVTTKSWLEAAKVLAGVTDGMSKPIEKRGD